MNVQKWELFSDSPGQGRGQGRRLKGIKLVGASSLSLPTEWAWLLSVAFCHTQILFVVGLNTLGLMSIKPVSAERIFPRAVERLLYLHCLFLTMVTSSRSATRVFESRIDFNFSATS